MRERARQLHVVPALATINLTAGIVFDPILGWL
jgi:hypothetical protein